MIFSKRKIASRDSREIVPIVRDGAIAMQGEFNGRLVPLLRLDTSHRADVADLIGIHSTGLSGDVTTQWGELFGGRRNVALFLDFVKPYQTSAILKFDIVTQGIIVDSVLNSKHLYLEVGSAGDVSPVLSDERARMLVLMPETGFDLVWPTLRSKALYAHYRSKGLSRKDSKQAASTHADVSRELVAARLKR
jgi:hypothetical protein